jgi:hypothetical protein
MRFRALVSINDKTVGVGMGENKRTAKLEAHRQALISMAGKVFNYWLTRKALLKVKDNEQPRMDNIITPSVTIEAPSLKVNVPNASIGIPLMNVNVATPNISVGGKMGVGINASTSVAIGLGKASDSIAAPSLKIEAPTIVVPSVTLNVAASNTSLGGSLGIGASSASVDLAPPSLTVKIKEVTTISTPTQSIKVQDVKM